MEKLPDDLVQEILGFSTGVEAARLGLTCQALKDASLSPAMWRLYFERDYALFSGSARAVTEQPRAAYKAAYETWLQRNRDVERERLEIESTRRLRQRRSQVSDRCWCTNCVAWFTVPAALTAMAVLGLLLLRDDVGSALLALWLPVALVLATTGVLCIATVVLHNRNNDRQSVFFNLYDDARRNNYVARLEMLLCNDNPHSHNAAVILIFLTAASAVMAGLNWAGWTELPWTAVLAPAWLAFVLPALSLSTRFDWYFVWHEYSDVEVWALYVATLLGWGGSSALLALRADVDLDAELYEAVAPLTLWLALAGLMALIHAREDCGWLLVGVACWAVGCFVEITALQVDGHVSGDVAFGFIPLFLAVAIVWLLMVVFGCDKFC